MWRHGGSPFLYPGEGRERVSARPGEAVRRLGGAVGCAREGMAEAKMRVSVESEARTEAWRVLHGARPLSFPSRRVLGEETGRQWQRHSCLSPHHAPPRVTSSLTLRRSFIACVVIGVRRGGEGRQRERPRTLPDCRTRRFGWEVRRGVARGGAW